MTRTWLTDAPIDVAAVRRAVEGPGAGAAVVFVGTVRDENRGRAVAGMRYEAYPAMAGQVLAAIVAEAEARWSESAVAAVHRTGDLAIGEASVVIAVAAPHRAEAYDASRYVIEAIKERLPIWKKERYEDGSEAWLDGVVPPGGENARV
jgi:molybdopterin synthase catalytic subunit